MQLKPKVIGEVAEVITPYPLITPSQYPKWVIILISLLLQKGDKYSMKTTRISEMFAKVDKPSMSSSYDTAWLAMVPSKGCKDKPLFPECVEWIMENQRPDGSWSVDPYHPLLLKDSLSSTLACLLALHKWRVGQDMVKRGLKFIEQNSWAANDERQLTPIGFDIIFPGLVEQAIEHGITLPLDPSLVNELLEEREKKVGRGHIGYVLEGFDGESNWKDAMKRQNQNGSFANSPSSTAAALLHNYDIKCHEYLDSILRLNYNAVPAVYPVTIYNNLRMIDNLQQLGIERLFKDQIEIV
ncbi:hypothetical protein K2173_000478 [Erythroxylum novogranatense]|uniref:Terpene synthase N-terminal domain-containing protein n=1 Tax=Erythroxylum novogranatense TaxID=1862640 RepID=A0AAV8SWD1_9ROSI|nr:hypothetical protein K2173_000478 [Erythroxylum novogranatense]